MTKVFRPQIGVVLKKNIGRATAGGATTGGIVAASKRFTGTARQIDLTPYLGDGAAVTTSKSVRAPMGAFSITLVDKFVPGEFESLWGLIEPLDLVEIRMARDTAKYAGAFTRHMPIIMRGFVSDVQRHETMGEDGIPRRVVVIEGQDYGRVLDLIRYSQFPGYAVTQYLVDAFQFWRQYGSDTDSIQDASDFVRLITQRIIQPFLDAMRAASVATTQAITPGARVVGPILPMQVQAIVKDASVMTFGIQEWPGNTLMGLLTSLLDIGAFNELFVQDFESGPVLIYRPNPFKDITGKFISPVYASAPSTADETGTAREIPLVPPTRIVTGDELMELHTSRSERDVFNYVWISSDSSIYGAAGVEWATATAAGDAIAGGTKGQNFSIANYPNAASAFYGFRMLQARTAQVPRIDDKTGTAYDRGVQTVNSILSAKRDQLIAQNKDNSVFTRGTMRLRGREDIHAGEFIRLRRGNFEWDAYAVSVTHQFIPFRLFTTTVAFDRGFDIINRLHYAGSPYFAEMIDGVRGA